jgi:vancomycin resistance protein VanJ
MATRGAGRLARSMTSRPRSAAPANTAHPAARSLKCWIVAYLIGLVAVALALHLLSDRWWPATVILFSPRWLWALPLLVLVPLAAIRARRWLWPLGLAGLLQLFGISAYIPPSLAALNPPAGAPGLRLSTYNIGGGGIEPAEVVLWLDEAAPQVALFQECGELISPVRDALKARGWQVEVQHGSCVASRFPIRKVEARDPSAIWKMYGSGVIVRYEIETPSGMVNVFNQHLATVRPGLNALRERRWGGVSALESNIEQRELESMLSRAFVSQAKGPVIVGGDFNMPVESAIYRRHWSDMNNAFSCAGMGLGTTKATRWHGVRIDHVLLGPGWQCLQTRVARRLGGDHFPMIAEMRWEGQR